MIFSLRQAEGVLHIRWKSLPVSYDCSENILFSRSYLARATDVKKKKAVVEDRDIFPLQGFGELFDNCLACRCPFVLLSTHV